VIDKRVPNLEAAVAGIFDGATVLISGFGEAGSPTELIHTLIDQGATNLTVVSNNAGNGHVGLAALIEHGRVAKMICSFPRSSNSVAFDESYTRGEIELELVPQGTLAERLRAAGAGIPAFYTPTSVGTSLAEGKEVREFDGRRFVLEHALHADFALVMANQADRLGNLTYRMTTRNYGPVMCTAAECTIAQARQVGEAGSIDPEHVVTPGIFVDRVVHVAAPKHESALIKEGVRYP
jgi:3-oxoadipate CoA-transferase, alpha subunit